MLDAYVRPGSEPGAAVAADRTCLAEAMIGGGFNALLEGDPREAASDRHGWTSPVAEVPTSSAARGARRIDCLASL